MTDATLLERRDGPVAYLTLNRPEAMNAIGVALATALRDACLRAEADARVVVLAGAGGNFSVGGDAGELARLRERGRAGVRELLDAFRAACETIARLRIPVVAAVRGYALAGGFEIVQCCDVAVVGETARLGDHHANMGVVPAGGGSQRLPRIVGRSRALAHLLTGEHLTASDAVAWGIAHQAVPESELDEAVRTIANRLAEKNGEALAVTKALVNQGLALSLDEALDREQAAATDWLVAPDGLGRLAGVGR